MLTCRDTRASVAFYRDTLGFRLDEAWPDRESPKWASLSLGLGRSREVPRVCS